MFYQSKFGSKSASQFAWIAPAIVAVALIIVYFFGEKDTFPDTRFAVIEASGFGQVIQLGKTEEATSESYVPPASKIREATLQNLSEFRAEYKVVSPGIALLATGDSPANTQLLNTLGGMLSHYHLREDQSPDNLSSSEYALTLYVREKDVTMTHKLIMALSPMIRGNVAIIFHNELAAGQVILAIADDAAYSNDGVAYF
ncbi:MAG: hypothetical protein EP334_05550 [Gammaproteobacteria bacterium]|nr:MAG: hypothetical protein EP334_05550 [Gammaproteobacteria bacterium]